MQKYRIEFIDEVKDEYNDNVDIQVHYNSSKYIATFFTLKNIEYIMQQYSISGECNNGSYFWASNSVIVQSLKHACLESVIGSLIETDEFFDVFEKIS